MDRKSTGVTPNRARGRYNIYYYRIDATPNGSGIKTRINIGDYGVIDNQDNYAQAIIFHDCAITQDDKITDKFAMYTREIEPSLTELAEYQQWLDERNAAKNAARAKRLVYDKNKRYAIYYKNENGLVYVGSFGRVGNEDDKNQAIIYHDCAIYRNKDARQEYDRTEAPTEKELEDYDNWKKEVDLAAANRRNARAAAKARAVAADVGARPTEVNEIEASIINSDLINYLLYSKRFEPRDLDSDLYDFDNFDIPISPRSASSSTANSITTSSTTSEALPRSSNANSSSSSANGNKKKRPRITPPG